MTRASSRRSSFILLVSLVSLGAMAVALPRCTSRPRVEPINPWGSWTNEPQAYEVVKSRAPNPFTRAGCKVVLEPMTHDSLMVGSKTVGQYEGEKGETVAASFEQDLDDANRRFAAALEEGTPDLFEPSGRAPDNTFIMRPRMTVWEPGFKVTSTTPSVPRDSEMTILVDVVGPGGDVLDEIRLNGTEAVHDEPAIDLTFVHTGGATLRMHELATRLGKNVSRYIDHRWSCRAP